MGARRGGRGRSLLNKTQGYGTMGDAAAAVVVDPGAWSFKCGLAGDDRPRVRVPGAVGVGAAGAALRVGRSELAQCDEPGLQVKEVVERGRVVHWDGFEALLAYSERVLDLPGGSGAARRYLVAEGHDSVAADRDKLAELLFERFGASQAFVSRTAPLCLFANGRSSGIVLDVGCDLSSASVVVEGFLNRDSVQALPLGGRLLASVMLERLEERGIAVRPRFSFTTKTLNGERRVSPVDAPCHPSFSRFWRLDIAEELVHEACRVNSVVVAAPPKARGFVKLGGVAAAAAAAAAASSSCFSSSSSTTAVAAPTAGSETAGAGAGADEDPAAGGQDAEMRRREEAMGIPAAPETYVLPDGTEVSAAACLGRQVSELLLDPRPLKRSEIPVGLPELVLRCAQTVGNADQRKELLGNVVLCGGPSIMWGLPARVAGEIAARAKGMKSRVIVAGPPERQVAAWIGGSIIGCLPSLTDLWVTRQEYQDQGARALRKKCP